MQLTFLKGYPDRIGKRAAFVANGTGPASYVTGGDLITDSSGHALGGPFGFYLDYVGQILTVSGLYEIKAKPGGLGVRQTWKLVWYVVSSGAEVNATTNLSAEQVQVAGFGGQY